MARQNPDGRAFTDHKINHVEMVAEKSLEVGDAIKKAVEKGGLENKAGEGRVAFSGDIDKKTLEGAALSHDTGMSGNGYALTPVLGENGKQLKDENGKKVYEKDAEGNYVIHQEDNSIFNEVRENHSLNSCINVLKNRDAYKDAGYTDEQIDKMAVECMAHSKSSSGVSDLNSKADWSDCFDRIDSTVEAYNKDHPDSTISFDRTPFEINNSKLSSLASETLALRVGDVSRDSFWGAEAQSGEHVQVDRATLNNHDGSMIDQYPINVEGKRVDPDTGKEIHAYDLETRGANIKIGNNDITSSKSRQVHAGEQNIIENHTFLDNENKIVHQITVDDGSSAPYCTHEALNDHLGELASAKAGSFVVDIKFVKPCDKYSKDAYENFRDINAKKYSNVEIRYPWDDEGE